MSSNTPAKYPPKNTVPFLKVLTGVFRFVENPIPIINDALEQYGSTYYTRIVGGRRVIMTVDPDVVQHVLQKNHRNYYKSELQSKSLGRYIGNGLLTSNGTYWLKQRRLIQPGFHKSRMSGLVDIMNLEIRAYCEDLASRIAQESTLDVSHEMMEMTLRVVSKALFSTGISYEKIKELGNNFTELQIQIVREVRQPFLNWWRKLSGKRARTLALADETKQIVRDIIAARKTSTHDFDDLLDMLLKTRYEDDGQSMNDGQVLDEAIILFTAGHETTANALTWMLYLLDANRDVLERLRSECGQLKTGNPGMRDLAGLTYTTHVIRESLRLYPPAWILDRVALDDDLVKDIRINKGDMVGLFVYGTHHNSDLWSDPEKFNPDRFDVQYSKDRHPYAFYPFGGGPRLCIGHHFAMLEMQLALFHLLRYFDFKVVPGHPVALQPLITLRPKYGMRMNIGPIAAN